MSSYWQSLLSLTIILPLGIGLVRYNALRSTYQPLLILLLAGLLNELISMRVSNNTFNTNLYFLVEFLIYIWQFYKWRPSAFRKKNFFILAGVMLTIWLTENFFFKMLLKQVDIFFVICDYFILFLLAVDEITWLIINSRQKLFLHPVGVICLSIILYFGFNTLGEIFYYFSIDNDAKNSVFSISAIINVIFNLILGYALLCIPKATPFIRL